MTKNSTISKVLEKNYQYGFISEVKSEKIPKGLNEDVIRLISTKKKEPKFLLDFRLKAYKQWKRMDEPTWANINYPKIDYQEIVYYSAPKDIEKKKSLDDIDPEILKTFDKLGIPLNEQKRLSNVAVDAVFDSVSIATTFKEKLAEDGVIFCSISEAVQEYPDLIKKYLGKVVPINDNFLQP